MGITGKTGTPGNSDKNPSASSGCKMISTFIFYTGRILKKRLRLTESDVVLKFLSYSNKTFFSEFS